MQVGNQANWDNWRKNNTAGYGRAIMAYAERWANLVEEGMASGMPLEKIAKKASHDADTEGITGFMYGTAVQVLATSWAHGEDLRRWHNLDTQIHNEGEEANKSGRVLNPALLNIRGS